MKYLFELIEDTNGACFICYIVLVFGGAVFSVVADGVTGIVAVAGLGVLVGTLASRRSRLRFHAYQAVLIYEVGALAMILVFLSARSNAAGIAGAGAFVLMGQTMIITGVLIIAIGAICIYTAENAGNGKDVRLPAISSLALWMAEIFWDN